MSPRRPRLLCPRTRWLVPARTAAVLLAGMLAAIAPGPSVQARPLPNRPFAPSATAAADADALAATLGPEVYAIVPLRRSAGPHLEAIARINGITGRFLVDTGAQITVVNSTSLGKFHLAAVKTGVRVYGAVGGPGETIQAALASRLQLGPCEASPFLLGVSDLSALNQGRPGHESAPFDGIIGADVLQTFSFIVDCNGLRLYARPDATNAHGGNQTTTNVSSTLGGVLHHRGYAEIPMKRLSISDFEIMANVNGHRALWLVDTGAAITLLDTNISRRAGIKLQPHELHRGRRGRRAAAHRHRHRREPEAEFDAGAFGGDRGVRHLGEQRGVAGTG